MNTWSGRIGAALVALVCAAGILAPLIAPVDPFATSGTVLQAPSRRHPLGSDDLGRDLFSGIIHGARWSLVIALSTTAAGLALGVLVGAVAGYAPGAVDDVLMRLTEIVQVMPRLFLVLAASAVIGGGIGRLILILALTSWTGIARMVRSQVLSIRAADHVTAARAAGASPARIVGRHILPLTRGPLVTQTAFQASGAILVEAGLSFLGLGDPTIITWGAMLHEGQHFLRVAWWMPLFPGIALTLTVLGIHLLADALGDSAADLAPGENDRRRAAAGV